MKAVPRLWSPVLLAAALLAAGSACAYEMRTWTSADGKTIEAELTSFDGAIVTAKSKAGDRLTFKKEKLSQADLLYLKEYAPVTAVSGWGVRNKPKEKTANPAKEAVIDRKQFKPGKDFQIPDETFLALETPHFKVLYSKGTKPEELAELAERLWLDAAFFHATFPQKFTERKLAIFLVDDEYTYQAIGQWFAKLLEEGNANANAAGVRATWKESAAGTISMPAAIADPNGILPNARVFRGFQSTGSGDKRPEKPVKGVWNPFRVHCIAGDLLGVQTGGVQGFGAKGYYALLTGYSYYKEIFLTGTSETSILSAQSNNSAKSAGGFKSEPKTWADELRKLIRKGTVKPGLAMLYDLEGITATAETNVLAYSFAEFLHSSPERVAGWCALVERISTSNQVPESEDLAKLLGFADAATLEKQWIEFVRSTKFK